MVFFPNAHHFQIQGGEFHSVQNVHHGPSGIDILLAASTPDAASDAEARRYAPSCFPGTREQYIGDITRWATSTTDQSPLIYWLRGPAGVGKSALAQTCAEKVRETGQFGAAFFFSVSGRNDHRKLFTTLAYQLSTVLPDFRQIVDNKVQNDKTLVTKNMSSQFQGLIVEPLRELEKQRKGVQRRAIFIDGLDECSSNDAQEDIIRIIAASVRAKSTPFRWAIFSRPASQITTVFNDPNISALSCFVELPISRKVDQEIELYLQAGFRNILRRRNILELSSTWPCKEDIKKLVDASAGLFAYPATILRFIDHHSYTGFMDSLKAVLNAISQPRTQQPFSPFATLDAFYILVMKRIPEDVLSIAQLFFACGINCGFGTMAVALYCNYLGISQAEFRAMMDALQSVLKFWEPLASDQLVDIVCSRSDDDPLFQPIRSPWFQLFSVHGLVEFHHKSFYDFLIDPSRSSGFCVATTTARKKLFDHLVQRHHHFARSYTIQGNELVLAAGVSSPSASLPWPHGNEFVDSFLMLYSFCNISNWLSPNHRAFPRFLKDVSPSSLRNLTGLHYRKSLINALSVSGDGLFWDASILGFERAGIARNIAGTRFRAFQSKDYSSFDPKAFVRMVKKLKGQGIIEPYHHRLPSTLASAYQFISQLNPFGKTCGLFKFGREEKSVIWYWEFDTEKRYFHEFRTLNFLEAYKIYKTDKFRIWKESWERL